MIPRNYESGRSNKTVLISITCQRAPVAIGTMSTTEHDQVPQKSRTVETAATQSVYRRTPGYQRALVTPRT
jgi:hypothetical protein